jgi:hypothetical protein
MDEEQQLFIHSVIRSFSPVDMGCKQTEITRKQPEITRKPTEITRYSRRRRRSGRERGGRRRKKERAMAMAVLSVRAAMPVSSTRAAAAHTEFYDLLRVDKKASSSQLKTAYRKLALEHHPDVSQHPDANRRFVQLSNAYEVSIVSFFSRSHSFSFSFFLWQDFRMLASILMSIVAQLTNSP